MKKYLSLYLILTVMAWIPTLSYAQDSDASDDMDTTVESDTTVSPDDEVDMGDEGEMSGVADGVEVEEDNPLYEDDETELYNTDFEVSEETIEGEVVAINDLYITIETADGEQVEVSRGGGTLLLPFVRQADLGSLQVGDNVTVTLANEVSIDGEVAGVNTDGTITVVTKDGERRMLSPGNSEVEVMRNGQVVTDYSTLSAGDEVTLVYSGELISDVDAIDATNSGGWIVPAIIILIVIVLAFLLAKRNQR